jgi:hypothetical protein
MNTGVSIASWFSKAVLLRNVNLWEDKSPQRPGEDVLPRRQSTFWAIGLMKPLPISDTDRKGDWDWHWTHRQGDVYPTSLPPLLLALYLYLSMLMNLVLVLLCHLHNPCSSNFPGLHGSKQPLTICPCKGGADQGTCGGERGNPPPTAAAHLQWQTDVSMDDEWGRSSLKWRWVGSKCWRWIRPTFSFFFLCLGPFGNLMKCVGFWSKMFLRHGTKYIESQRKLVILKYSYQPIKANLWYSNMCASLLMY